MGFCSRSLLFRYAGLIAGVILHVTVTGIAPVYAADNDERLKDIKNEITRRQQSIKQRKQAIDDAQQQLRTTELAVGKAAKAVKRTALDIAETQRQQQHLTQQQRQLEQKQKQQQQVLAAQLRSAYQTGQHGYLQMLLEQQSTDRLERVLSYYEYFNKARVQDIEALIASGRELTAVGEKLEQTEARQQTLHERQQQEVAKLKQRQTQQDKAVAKLKTLLSDDQQLLAQLEESREELRKLIERQPVDEQPSMRGLGRKGKLSWPVKGSIRHHYNSIRQGGVRWKGVIVTAGLGTDIKAVAGGQVLYADWLKGMGLVMVVDHGAGYMSIYGHAQALLKQAGDAVRAGEVVALVGKSGGNNETGLYFELRKNGKTINPEQWCR